MKIIQEYSYARIHYANVYKKVEIIGIKMDNNTFLGLFKKVSLLRLAIEKMV